MNRETGHIDVRHSRARGSSHLYRRTWLPQDPPRAAIILVHGLGEHSGRYENLARHCTDLGFAVHAIDHYGHGKSDGHPGYVERFSVYLDGVRALHEYVRQLHGETPVFLLGHSMGGLISAAYLLEQQHAFRACVLSGPALKSDAEPPALVMVIVRLLAALLPTVPLLGLDPAGVSRDPEVVRDYVADALVHHGKLTARLIAEMSKAMRNTLAQSGAIRLPLLIMHGDQDVLTSPAGSQALLDAVSSEDKTLKRYPGLYHEIFNEPEKDDVLTDMTNWLEAHLT